MEWCGKQKYFVHERLHISTSTLMILIYAYDTYSCRLLRLHSLHVLFGALGDKPDTRCKRTSMYGGARRLLLADKTIHSAPSKKSDSTLEFEIWRTRQTLIHTQTPPSLLPILTRQKKKHFPPEDNRKKIRSHPRTNEIQQWPTVEPLQHNLTTTLPLPAHNTILILIFYYVFLCNNISDTSIQTEKKQPDKTIKIRTTG